MPGYNVHRLFNYTVFIGISLLLYVWNIDLKQFLALSAGYYIGTEFITPDLDTNSAAIKKWGMLRVLWLPYKWLFRHGQSSHNIVYGAAVRIFYLSIILLSIYYFLFKSLPLETIISSAYVFIFLIGVIISNVLHVILDILFR
jgi:uncharacterized metal-binding protein